ncbi:serine-rich adhesin for platelets-like isoform X2 [Lineus longissimus]|uniref:serine-rich adhesin for platelets-like isoform X2 n=1 Tax=Lineus longissimus TaxID=88925 RepID=UPI002B4CCF15
MEDSNDFSDFQPANKSFRVFRTKQKGVIRDKLAKSQKLTQVDDTNVLQSHARMRRKNEKFANCDTNTNSANTGNSSNTRKFRNKSKPPATKAKNQNSGLCRTSQTSYIDNTLAHENTTEKGLDSDVTVVHQSPQRSERKEQRSATPNSTSKNQTILNSYFDIKSTPTTPVGKQTGSNSSGKRSSQKASQSKSARAKRRLSTEDSKVPKSRLGKKKRGALQSQTSCRKKRVQTYVIDDSDSDVVCIGDAERATSKQKMFDDFVDNEEKRDAVKSIDVESVDTAATESSSKGCTNFNELDEDVCPGAEGFQNFQLDRSDSEEDVFTGNSKIDHAVEELFSDEMDDEAGEVLPLDRSEEDVFTGSVSSHLKKDVSGDNLYPGGELGCCTVFSRDISEENIFSGNMTSSKRVGEECQEDIFLDLEDISMRDCAVKPCSQGGSLLTLTEDTNRDHGATSIGHDNATKVESNDTGSKDVSQKDFAPPSSDFPSLDEGESDDEFFAALDILEENQRVTRSDKDSIESTASSVSSTLACGQQPSRTSGLLSTLSNLSSQFSLFSGRSTLTSSVPDSETVDSTGKSQSSSNEVQETGYKVNSNASKQTSISSFFKAKFSVSSNGVPLSVAAGTRSKSMTATKTQRQSKEESSQSQPNAYQSDSSGTSSNFSHLQVYSGSKRSCPFYKKIPGTGFTVDAFRYGTIPDCTGYFLTHFHYDHYGGLAKKFSQQIYCNQITCNLVRKKIGVTAKFITVLPMNEPCDVQGVNVTLLDANHCPGAAMFLFRLRNGQTILHVGDFRASRAMESYPALTGTKIHQLYLDTTYCDPAYTFPPQEETIAITVNIVLEAIEDDPNTLFVCGTYTIGKEKIFLAIAEALSCKVCVNKDKKDILECLEDQHIKDILTLRWEDTKVHVLPMGQLNAKRVLFQGVSCVK